MTFNAPYYLPSFARRFFTPVNPRDHSYEMTDTSAEDSASYASSAPYGDGMAYGEDRGGFEAGSLVGVQIILHDPPCQREHDSGLTQTLQIGKKVHA